ncbi:hypothetical protein ACFQMH_33350 [Streptomyces viridiviolaceus]|uniref:SpdD-like protein n=1 Tax=Streptomyces viridiviolaceus TaxID=68282 RepID=A0ABW2E954_9ACTN
MVMAPDQAAFTVVSRCSRLDLVRLWCGCMRCSTAPAPSRPTVQLIPGTVLALVGGGTAVVLVVGAVLVSMLLAVAITGASVAVCALVIRPLVNADTKRR